MGKMEAAGEVLGNMNPQQISARAQQQHSSETSRREEIEFQIRRMYSSARQPAPAKGSSVLRLEVEDAMQLWKAIPTEMISEAVQAGIIAAGNFLATNGAVAKAWNERRPKEAVADHAALGNRIREDEKRFLAAPDARQPTAEEKEANAKMFAELSRKLRMA